jgi:hypothetical protein
MLVENNILERLHSSIMLNWGAAGNVIAYNYSEGVFDSSATNVLTMDMAVHGAHPQFNLWEGNVVPNIYPDYFWGSSSHNTAFRNWTTGTSKIATPYTGRGPVDWANAHWATQNIRGIQLAYTHTSFNIVGNVTSSANIGNTPVYSAGPAPCSGCVVAPSSRNYNGTYYPFSFGFSNSPDASGPVTPMPVGTSFNTSFLHGNYDPSSGIVWDLHGTGSHTLPASFYRNTKPSWWGNLPWPAIGPDVTGGTGPGGHSSLSASNRAQACYNNTPKDVNGMLVFDANTCYPTGASGTPPPPPTGLNSVVQ